MSHLSACFVVVEIHERNWIFWLLSALPSIASINKCSREGDAEIYIVRASRPLKQDCNIKIATKLLFIIHYLRNWSLIVQITRLLRTHKTWNLRTSYDFIDSLPEIPPETFLATICHIRSSQVLHWSKPWSLHEPPQRLKWHERNWLLLYPEIRPGMGP